MSTLTPSQSSDWHLHIPLRARSPTFMLLISIHILHRRLYKLIKPWLAFLKLLYRYNLRLLPPASRFDVSLDQQFVLIWRAKPQQLLQQPADDKRTAHCVIIKYLLKILNLNIFRLMLTVVASILKYIYSHIILYSRK